MNQRSNLIRTTILALVGIVAVLLVAAPAASAAGDVAKAKERLQVVQARLSDVSTQSEIAVEKYNQASSQLEAVQAKIDENQRQLETARKNLSTANDQMIQRARNMYKSRDVDVIDIVFQANDFDEFISELDMMERLGNSDVDTVHAIAAYKREIKDRRVRLVADEKTATRLVADREQQKNQLIALQADLQDLTGKIEKQIKKLKYQAKLRAQLALQGYSGPIPGPVDPNSPGHPEIVNIAQQYFGVPYVWGGASPSGFDCSGLTMYCLREDRHRHVARRHRPAALEHAGRPQRPPARRPHLLRQRELQPPRGHLRRGHHVHRGAAHRRRRALRHVHRPRRLDRRPVLRRPARAPATAPSPPQAQTEVSFSVVLPNKGHGERTRATGAAR